MKGRWANYLPTFSQSMFFVCVEIWKIAFNPRADKKRRAPFMYVSRAKTSIPRTPSPSTRWTGWPRWSDEALPRKMTMFSQQKSVSTRVPARPSFSSWRLSQGLLQQGRVHCKLQRTSFSYLAVETKRSTGKRRWRSVVALAVVGYGVGRRFFLLLWMNSWRTKKSTVDAFQILSLYKQS